MSTYYLVNKETAGIFPLGETSFKTFYPEDYWYFLNTAVEQEDIDFLASYTIRNDKGDTLEIVEFLEELSNYKIMD